MNIIIAIIIMVIVALVTKTVIAAVVGNNGSSSVYISGPISGIVGFRAAFLQCELYARRFFSVGIINPALFEVVGWSQAQYMSHWLKIITSRVGTMIMLPGWKSSKGACREHALAMELGIEILYYVPEYDTCMPVDTLNGEEHWAQPDWGFSDSLFVESTMFDMILGYEEGLCDPAPVSAAMRGDEDLSEVYRRPSYCGDQKAPGPFRRAARSRDHSRAKHHLVSTR